MSRILQQDKAEYLGDLVVEAMEDSGYTTEEIIPGLVNALFRYAESTADPEQCLDEVANLIADGPTYPPPGAGA